MKSIVAFLNQYLIVLALCFLNSVNSQRNVVDSTSLMFTQSIVKPSLVSSHPLGIFFSRWEGNFKSNAQKKISFNMHISSANIWSPPVVGYFPNNPNDRLYVSQFPWHAREFKVDVDTLNAKSIEVQNDGIIKGMKVHATIPVSRNSELKIGIRTFLLTKGKLPFSLLTNDEVIEFFHDNIAGGNDPFDRKLYGLNEGKIRYQDQNNNVLNIEAGNLILSGFEFSYYYYLNNNQAPKNIIYINFGTHAGINTSKYNRSVDLGISANLLKVFDIKNQKKINVGLSLGTSRTNVIILKQSNIEFNNNPFIGYLEAITELTFRTKKPTKHHIGIDFYLQTSLNTKSEFNYLIPTKNGVSFKSWNSGISNLYKNNNYWTLMYSIEKKITTTFYLQQDLTVNNNPDIQTGINVSFGL